MSHEARNNGWVNVGRDQDTASFAVGSHSTMVARHGQPRLSVGAAAAHLCGQRRQQRLPRPAVES